MSLGHLINYMPQTYGPHCRRRKDGPDKEPHWPEHRTRKEGDKIDAQTTCDASMQKFATFQRESTSPRPLKQGAGCQTRIVDRSAVLARAGRLLVIATAHSAWPRANHSESEQSLSVQRCRTAHCRAHRTCCKHTRQVHLVMQTENRLRIQLHWSKNLPEQNVLLPRVQRQPVAAQSGPRQQQRSRRCNTTSREAFRTCSTGRHRRQRQHPSPLSCAHTKQREQQVSRNRCGLRSDIRWQIHQAGVPLQRG
jgi:hypothetical protein